MPLKDRIILNELHRAKDAQIACTRRRRPLRCMALWHRERVELGRVAYERDKLQTPGRQDKSTERPGKFSRSDQEVC